MDGKCSEEERLTMYVKPEGKKKQDLNHFQIIKQAFQHQVPL